MLDDGSDTRSTVTPPSPAWRPISQRGQPIHLGAVREGALAGGDVLALAAPGLERGGLQRAAIRERQRPRQRARCVHQRQVLGRCFVRLAAGKERDARHRRRHRGLEAASSVFSATSAALACFAHFCPAMTMFGFSTMPSSVDARVIELAEHRAQRPLGHLVAAVDGVGRMIAVHQHLGLDDGHDVRLPGTAPRSARARARWP